MGPRWPLLLGALAGETVSSKTSCLSWIEDSKILKEGTVCSKDGMNLRFRKSGGATSRGRSEWKVSDTPKKERADEICEKRN